MESLTERPATPTQLAERTGIERSGCSRVLGQLVDVGAAQLLVPDATVKGRVYGPTDDGERALAVVSDA